MADSRALRKQLERFGLTENQAAVYLLLVEHKELRIQEITKLAQIPRSTVYESLKGLFEHGLAEEIVEENYKVIRPYPIEVLKNTLNERIYELQGMTASLESVGNVLASMDDMVSLRSTTVRYYRDVAGARQLFWNTLKSKGTVYVYSAFGRSKFVGKKFYMNFVTESAERQIKEQVLINPTRRAFDLILRDDGSSLARTKIDTIRTLDQTNILIQGETFIYDDVYAQVYLDTGEINGFEIESKLFTETQRSIFETLWKMAEPVSPLLTKDSTKT